MTLEELLAYRPTEEEVFGVDGLLYRKGYGFFVQKRAADRKFLPNCWDVCGGHVENGESLIEALQREVQEETGWQLTKARAWIDSYCWEAKDNKIAQAHTFLIEVDGDLDNPAIEVEKNSEWRWIAEGDLEILNEGRQLGGQNETFGSILKWYRWLKVHAEI